MQRSSALVNTYLRAPLTPLINSEYACFVSHDIHYLQVHAFGDSRPPRECVVPSPNSEQFFVLLMSLSRRHDGCHMHSFRRGYRPEMLRDRPEGRERSTCRDTRELPVHWTRRVHIGVRSCRAEAIHRRKFRWIGRVIEFPCSDNGSPIPLTMPADAISGTHSALPGRINSPLKSVKWGVAWPFISFPLACCFVSDRKEKIGKKMENTIRDRATLIPWKVVSSPFQRKTRGSFLLFHEAQIVFRTRVTRKRRIPSTFPVHCPPAPFLSLPHFLFFHRSSTTTSRWFEQG